MSEEKKTKKKKVMPFLIIGILIVILTVTLFAFQRFSDNGENSNNVENSNQTEDLPTGHVNLLATDRFSDPLETTTDGVLKESMILSADCTQFYVGEMKDITLTIYAPADIISGNITITDDSGKNICEINSKTMTDFENGQKTISITIPFFSETDGVLFYTAHMGEFRSNSLTLFVTPEITDAQLDECENICNELATHMQKVGEQEGITNEEKLKQAEAWISENEKIKEYKVDNTTIIFSTLDSILGIYTVIEDGYFGGGASKADSSVYGYNTGGQAINLFESYQSTGKVSDDDSWEFLNSGNTNTNNNVAVLRPLYNSDWRCKVDYHAEYGGKVADVLGGTCTVTNENSFYSFIAELNQYGTIIFNSHGNILTRKDGSNLFYTFLGLYDSENFRDQLFESLVQEDYEDGEERYTLKEFRSLFYGKVNESDSYRLMYGVSDSTPCIVMTSNYIIDTYQSSFFDNAFIYFGVCYSFCDSRLNTFFTNRGAQAYIGYAGTISTDLEKLYYEKIMDTALEHDNNISYTALNTLNTVVAENLSFIQEHVFKNWIGFWNSIGDLTTGSTSTEEYSGLYNDGYTFYGEKTLNATVQGYDNDTPVEWFGNAQVTAYRFENQQFTNMATVNADENGKITFENLRFGYYVFTITDKYDDIYTVSLLYDNQCPDEQEIKLEVTETGYVVSDDFELKDGFIRKVKQQKNIPAGYVGISTFEDLKNISNDMNGNYILMNDIVCSDYVTIPGRFEGILNGNGYTIRNVGAPVFENVYSAKIRNLSIAGQENYDISASLAAYKNYGLLATNCYNTTIENCHVAGSISAGSGEDITGNVSGLVGYGEKSTIENCYSEVTISIQATKYGVRGGGMTGDSKNVTYYNCYNQGNISVTSNSHGDTIYSYIPLQTGGMSGQASGDTVQYCYNSGSMTAAGGAFTSAQAGGIFGNVSSRSHIEKCWNTGAIKSDLATTTNMGTLESLPQGFSSVGGKEEADELRTGIDNINFMFWYNPSTGGIAGGIIGFGVESSMALCTNEGAVSGSYISGGIVGKARNMNFENMLNKGSVTGTFCLGGFTGYLSETSEKTSYVNCVNAGTVGTAEIYGNFSGVIDLNNSNSNVSGCYYISSCDDSMAICAKDSSALTFSSVSSLSSETLSGYDFEKIWEVTGDSVDIRY